MTTTSTTADPTPRTLAIQGMTCGACVARVEAALGSVPGVTECAVNLATGLATVTASVPDASLVDAVSRAGYTATPMTVGGSAQTLRTISAQQTSHVAGVKRRLLLGVLFSIPVLLIDFFHARLFQIHSDPGLIALVVAEFLFASAVVFFTGRPFFTGAARALAHRSANMDVLVALGSGVAYVYSVALSGLRIYALAADPHGPFGPHHSTLHPEYHAAVAIIVLVTLGKFLEARAKRAANTAVAALARDTAATATRLTSNDTPESISADLIGIGDRIQVLAHQSVPVDGVLIEGAGSLDQSILTGESVPIELSASPASSAPTGNRAPDAGPSSVVPSGARLLDGRIVIRATATAATSTVARILDMVNAAQSSKTQIQALADRVAGIFVPIVLVLAVITYAGWILHFVAQSSVLSSQHFASALIPTIATIVIACPCAMGLATPTALTVAIGRAAKSGILFTNAAALETAAAPADRTAVIFDKTGTLTEGRFAVSEVVPIPADVTGHAALQLAATLEQFSEHPLARALTAYAASVDVAALDPDSFSSVPGGGVKAELANTHYAAGSLSFLASLGIDTSSAADVITRLQSTGHTLVALGALTPSPRVLALFGLRDALRSDAGATLAALRAGGHRVGVLSGDTEPAVRAALAGVDLDLTLANVTPAGKAEALASLKTRSRETGIENRSIVFVGDGINDAPALAAADLGITLSSGTDLAKNSADVILLTPSLALVPQTLTLARKTVGIIRQNLFWAFAYNVAAIPLAMLGVLSPSIAAGAMILSSLTVVGNALRLHRTRLA